MRSFKALALAALLVSAAPALAAQASMPADSLAHARHLTDLFFNGRHDSVLVHFDAEGRAQTSVTELLDRLEELAGRAGLESEVLEEKFVKRNGLTQYWRTGKYTLHEEPILFRWAFNKQGQIAGMGVGPASQAPPIDPE
jgi:hypothetical protein